MHQDVIIQLLTAYQLPAVFLGSFLFGETVIITAAFLSAHGVWSIPNVFLFAFLGTTTADTLWFLFGQRVLQRFHRWKKTARAGSPLLEAVQKKTGGRPFLILLFIKFFTFEFLGKHNIGAFLPR